MRTAREGENTQSECDLGYRVRVLLKGNNGGKGGNLKVRVSSKLNNNIILSILLFYALPVWDFRNAGTFPENLFYP